MRELYRCIIAAEINQQPNYQHVMLLKNYIIFLTRN